MGEPIEFEVTVQGVPYMSPFPMTVALSEDDLCEKLRSRGWLCIPPGDTSPLGKLVRSAVGFYDAVLDEDGDTYKAGDKLAAAAFPVSEDPAVRAWAERGRDGK